MATKRGETGWGILGTGKIARILATAVNEAANGQLVAVASGSRERARNFGSDLSARRHYDDYRGVLEDPDVEIVHVAARHPDHRAWAVAAAEAGKHVLCEKPLALHAADAEEIVAAARRNNVFLMEAFAYRAHPQTERLVQLLRAGVIGEVRMIDVTFGYDAGPQPSNYLLTRAFGGGSILDVGCYTTSMSHLIARVAGGGMVAEAREVTGLGHIGPTGVDHFAAATLAFDNGLLARVACSVQLNLDSSLRIYGSDGRITVSSPWLPGRIGKGAEIVVQRGGSDPEVIEIDLPADVYTLEVEAVGALLRMSDPSPSIMPWDESLANMRTLDRWRMAIGLRYPDDPVDEGALTDVGVTQDRLSGAP